MVAHQPYSNTQIETARSQARDFLIKKARALSMVTYTEVTEAIKVISLHPNSSTLFRILGEISIDEGRNGRGMLSAIVIAKKGNHRPGQGFFDLVEAQAAADRARRWTDELKTVFEYWASHPSDSPES